MNIVCAVATGGALVVELLLVVEDVGEVVVEVVVDEELVVEDDEVVVELGEVFVEVGDVVVELVGGGVTSVGPGQPPAGAGMMSPQSGVGHTLPLTCAKCPLYLVELRSTVIST